MINDFFAGKSLRVLPKLAQDERKRLCPRLHFVDLESDLYESVVHDYAVTKISFIALASLLNLMGKIHSVAMASLEISFCGLYVAEGVECGHDRVCGKKTTQLAIYGRCAWVWRNWGQIPISSGKALFIGGIAGLF